MAGQKLIGGKFMKTIKVSICSSAALIPDFTDT